MKKERFRHRNKGFWLGLVPILTELLVPPLYCCFRIMLRTPGRERPVILKSMSFPPHCGVVKTSRDIF